MSEPSETSVRPFAVRLAAGVMIGGAAMAMSAADAMADPIEGRWFTPMKETVRIAPCGNSWCATVDTGSYAGTGIGVFTGSDGKYSAKITEPKNGRTVEGNARISGEVMHLEGCVAKLVCAKRDWRRL